MERLACSVVYTSILSLNYCQDFSNTLRSYVHHLGGDVSSKNSRRLRLYSQPSAKILSHRISISILHLNLPYDYDYSLFCVPPDVGANLLIIATSATHWLLQPGRLLQRWTDDQESAASPRSLRPPEPQSVGFPFPFLDEDLQHVTQEMLLHATEKAPLIEHGGGQSLCRLSQSTVLKCGGSTRFV